MREDPLVSVVINNYNYGRFLGEAIESALNQTYPRTEVVVVDDGSTDGSREVIAGYGERIIPIFKENGGQASAVNAGFEASTGEVVLFLDADDALLPDLVGRVVSAFLEEPNAAKVQYALQVIDAAGRLTGKLIPRTHYQMSEEELLRHILKFYSYPRSPMSGNAFSSAALGMILPIPEELYRTSADLYLNDLSVMFGPMVFLKEAGGLYRLHGTNSYARKDLTKDPTTMKSRLVRREDGKARLKSLFETRHSVKRCEIGPWDIFLLRDKVAFLRLWPESYPFGESLARLCVRGCVSSFIYPWLSPSKRALYTMWFLGMALVPGPLAVPLARRLLRPAYGRREPVGDLVARTGRALAERRRTSVKARREHIE